MTRVHGTLLAGLAVLTAAGFFVSRGPATTIGPARGVHAESQKSPGPAAKKSPRPTGRPDVFSAHRLPELPPPVEPPHPAGSVENQDWITTRTSELNDLSWFDDADSLRRILAELRNPLPEIRAAALEATKEFGSRDAIPYLAIIAEGTRDPAEQKAIADLIEYLNLPTMLERSEGDIE
ncbi:MAG: HEAT repeat domain-containing protein [Verrucomicrobiota bacterium]